MDTFLLVKKDLCITLIYLRIFQKNMFFSVSVSLTNQVTTKTISILILLKEYYEYPRFIYNKHACPLTIKDPRTPYSRKGMNMENVIHEIPFAF